MFTVTIRSVDAVFSLGLLSVVNGVVSEQLQDRRYFLSDDINIKPTVLFQEIDPVVDCRITASCIGDGFYGIVFFIMERSSQMMRNLPGCLKAFPVIFHDDSLAAVREKVLKQLMLWQRTGYNSLFPRACTACGWKRLTMNEIQVISLLAKEFSLTETAWVLGKNVKTVFTQKKSAMNKLNLSSSRELRSFIIKHRRALTIL